MGVELTIMLCFLDKPTFGKEEVRQKVNKSSISPNECNSCQLMLDLGNAGFLFGT